MSYRQDIIHKRTAIVTTGTQHYNYSDKFSDINMIIFGDSFSNGGGGGEDPFYQDLIGDEFKMNVLTLKTIHTIRLGYFESILGLIGSKDFEKIKPQYILLQCVERNAVNHLSNDVDWEVSLNEQQLNKILFKKHDDSIASTSFITSSNYNALLYNILYQFDDNAFFSMAYVTNLDNNMFSRNSGNKLFFYSGDLESISLGTLGNVVKVNNNLNKLANILNEKGIELVFMPTVDKFNLYEKYITNKSYPRSTFFENLRPLLKGYIFVDTKMVLRSALDRGVKDIYYSDDTHWSNIGSAIVVNSIFR